MITSNRSLIRLVDFYFDESVSARRGADIIRYNQFSRPDPRIACVPTHTVLLDLRETPDALLAAMKGHTRYKIRRAADKDGLSYTSSDGKDHTSIREFGDFYDRHSAFKHLPKASRKRMSILAAQDALRLSFVRDDAGEILVASSFLTSGRRVRGLQLAVAFRGTKVPSHRALIGRANRYARWKDILRFREMGFHVFDFGGWYAGTTDEQMLRVNEFKAEFGGRVVQEFSWQETPTLRGRLALKWLARQSVQAARAATANSPLETAG